MSIYWDAFTPWTALAGGVLIGLAAALMVVLLGRIAGISGIVGHLLQAATWRSVTQWGWRLAFVAGMLAAPLLWQFFSPLPEMQMPSNPWVIVLAGVLVGFGTRLGSGCTSGHGVCGLSRFSLRSLAATLMFMATGVVTVFVVRHVLV
jgi:uncharacterized membrane protein YedE/YeeE